MEITQIIASHIGEVTGEDFTVTGQHSIAGGCINSAFKLQGKGKDYFVKTNSASRLPMFEAEYAGLKEIADSASIRVPLPLCFGTAGRQAYLVMEYIVAGSHRVSASDKSMQQFGQQLAAMHQHTSDGFGWHMHNTIGSTEQRNSRSRDWLEFWRTQRLGFQLQLAAGNGYAGSLQTEGERLMSALSSLFDDYRPEASLLHGDLWSGNVIVDSDAQPVIYDPAVYYGDREADIAMTELFGGFSRRFYSAYQEAWPLSDGYPIRRDVYNLYHVLNHLNLFGGGYLGQASNLMGNILSQIR
ncbi:MAG: fructosamine kinase family protein [Gammaproteobacteria bacterium]|nr:MAG: fructosamine kinase family protein [Gammaproteobacteria bacterium]